MKLNTLTIVLVSMFLSSCQTVVQIPKFPTMPDELQKECEALETIKDTKVTIGKLLDTVAKNYSKYHECSAQNRALVEWYQEQKKIFDDLYSKQKVK